MMCRIRNSVRPLTTVVTDLAPLLDAALVTFAASLIDISGGFRTSSSRSERPAAAATFPLPMCGGTVPVTRHGRTLAIDAHAEGHVLIECWPTPDSLPSSEHDSTTGTETNPCRRVWCSNDACHSAMYASTARMARILTSVQTSDVSATLALIPPRTKRMDLKLPLNVGAGSSFWS